MKEFGKIIEYDGYDGKILTENGLEYLMLNDDADNSCEYEINDIVSFVPEFYSSDEYDVLIARFINKNEKVK